MSEVPEVKKCCRSCFFLDNKPFVMWPAPVVEGMVGKRFFECTEGGKMCHWDTGKGSPLECGIHLIERTRIESAGCSAWEQKN